MTSELVAVERVTRLRTPVVWFMAVAAALGTASIYPLQPAIAAVAGSLGASVAEIGTALACGPVGYMLGLAFLVPLVDRLPPRTVISAQFWSLAVALAAAAAVGSPWLLGLTIGVIGAGSAVGAQLSSIAGRFADPARRATVLGVVTAGISAGILLGRILGGWLADALGWRPMLLLLAAASAATAVAARALLPAEYTTPSTGYLSQLRSLPNLYARFPVLRLAATRGTLWFFAFCTIWSGLAVALSQPPFSYSPERIGLYASAGLLGIPATRIAGAWTDRVGPRRVILTGLTLAATATLLLGVTLSTPTVTLLCLALFDAGLFAAQVSNQSTVLALAPSTPARFNSAYMLIYFLGGSAGTAFGATATTYFGWPPTTLASTLAVAIATAITLSTRRAKQ
ncbi:MFS transporter [Nocardia sp. CDC160]|uniref:MFS transporter n=1 Tax=Nocardia sp. CDC160 TaxID=3112166 RepID=UPI002DBD305B|nr:MFS transporter [Nocardia sp. CDC160]MEC3916020.1 MFS transporter [Nocardia sp. CDC160]